MKKVVVMTTGGTIAMKYDPVTQGLIPAVSGDAVSYTHLTLPTIYSV